MAVMKKGELDDKVKEARAAGKQVDIHVGDGLYLRLGKRAATWVLRTATATAVDTFIRLADYSAMNLSKARDAAIILKGQIRDGRDPVAEKKAAKVAPVSDSGLTFAELAEAVALKLAEKEWRGSGSLATWRRTMDRFANPVIGHLLPEAVTVAHIRQIVALVLKEKTPERPMVHAAHKLLNRVALTLKEAYSLIPDERSVPGCPVDRFRSSPTGKSDLKVEDTVSHQPVHAHVCARVLEQALACDAVHGRALALLLLTALRVGEVVGLQWGEIDFEPVSKGGAEDGVTEEDLGPRITIPAHKMKMNREFVVPLSPAAVALLSSIPRPADPAALVFKSRPGAGAVSPNRLNRWLTTWAGSHQTVHGVRSGFRTWAAQAKEGEPLADSVILELCLSHDKRSKVEATYNRADYLPARRRVMEAWAERLAPVVVPLQVVHQPAA